MRCCGPLVYCDVCLESAVCTRTPYRPPFLATAPTGGGLGYDVISTEKALLQAFGGAAWNHESFNTGLSRDSAELLIGEELNYKPTARTKLFERFQYFPNLSDGGEYRLTFDAGLSTKLTKYLDWQLTLSDRYISNPVPGSKNNDLLLTTGIRFSFQQ